MKKIIFATCHLAAILSFNSVLGGMPQDSVTKSGIDFRVVTDRLNYPPGSTLHVKFIVTNTSETPIYLSRGLSVCSGQFGFVYFQLLDQTNREVRKEGCSADSWPLPGQSDVLKEVSDPKFWILLQPQEIYGGEAAFELPAKKGTYRLKAELIPPAFTDRQGEILAQQGTRVLQSPCPAPVVTITVR